MSREDRLRKIDEGKIAGTIQSMIGGYVSEKITEKVKLLTAAWRSGDISHDKMVGMIAGIATLEEIISDLENIQRQAYTAAQKEFGNG